MPEPGTDSLGANMLQPGALASCPLVLHVFSLGGYTFAQMLLLMSQNLGCHSSVAQCLWAVWTIWCWVSVPG